MLQWHEFEVRQLYDRPHHPILLKRRRVALFQLLTWVGALHNGHRAQEDEQVGASEHGLIYGDSGEDREVGSAGENDSALQEAEPSGGCRAEDATAVQSHTTGSGEFVVGEALLLDELLGHGVAGREEDGGGDRLGEQRPRGQLGLVPVFIS